MEKLLSNRSGMEKLFTVNRQTREKLENHPVDIYVRPPLLDIEELDFHKPEVIYKQGLAAKDDFKRQLEQLMANKTPLFKWLRKKK